MNNITVVLKVLGQNLTFILYSETVWYPSESQHVRAMLNPISKEEKQESEEHEAAGEPGQEENSN